MLRHGQVVLLEPNKTLVEGKLRVELTCMMNALLAILPACA